MSVAKIITKRAAKVIGWNKQERLYIVMTVKADINTNEFAHLIYQKTFLPLHLDCGHPWLRPFLPRCMECRRGLAIRILSVRPSIRSSVCPTNA